MAGPICHVMWAFTTGDACGPNMMTRNAYALNMGYVMEHAPRKPERAILEANMGGDKKVSHRYFEQGGHGKTVVAEVTLTDEAVRRVLRTTIDDLLELSWAGTHGAVASGMQSVAFTPATAIAAIFNATGQDLGMVGTSSMAHGTGKRVEGGLNAAIRLPGLEVGTVGGGTTLPYARAWLGLMDCAGPERSTASPRSSLRRPWRWRSPPRPRWPRPARRTSSRRTSSGAACAEDPAAPRSLRASGAATTRSASISRSPRSRARSGTRRRSRSTSATRAGPGSRTAGWSPR